MTLSGGFYVGLTETQNPWIIGFSMLPHFALGLVFSFFLLMIILALAYWLWEKLTSMVLFLRFLWSLYMKKDRLK